MQRHVIEVLYRERCPFVAVAIERVRAVICRLSRNVDIEIRLVQVDTMEAAIARSFRGSPTVRVDGVDVEPRASSRPLGTHARGYLDGEVIERAPPETWIASSLDRAFGAALGEAPTSV